MKFKNPVQVQAGDMLYNVQDETYFRARWATRAESGVQVVGHFEGNPTQEILSIEASEVYKWAVLKQGSTNYFNLEKFL
jgi:hypothetical protein